MHEQLAWVAAGLFLGFFVGLSFGKRGGARKTVNRLELERLSGGPRTRKTEPARTEEHAGPEEMVFLRWGGTHYHRKGCRLLRNRAVESISKEVALKRGLRRCPRCRP
jgi:hypothetical protein